MIQFLQQINGEKSKERCLALGERKKLKGERLHTGSGNANVSYYK